MSDTVLYEVKNNIQPLHHPESSGKIKCLQSGNELCPAGHLEAF